MSNGYVPVGCTGQITWQAVCGAGGMCVGVTSAALGCDPTGPGGCQTCGMAGFSSFTAPSDPPDPAAHTIVKFTAIAGAPVAVVCHPGPSALPKGQIITHINDIPMTPEGFVKATDLSVTELRLTMFDVRKAVAIHEIHSRS